MKSKNKDNEISIKLTVRMTAKEKERLQEKADQANKSLSRFLVDTALASEASNQKEAFLIAQRLIKNQRLIDDIEDQVVQQRLRKECASVWRG